MTTHQPGDIDVPILPPWYPAIRGPDLPDIPAPGNPLPVLAHGAKWTWDEVAGFTTSAFHSVTGWLSDTGSVVGADVHDAIDNAINVVQTSWSSFISTLEAWISAGLYGAAATVLDLGLYVRSSEIAIWHATEAAIDDVWQSIWDNVVGIDQTIDALRRYVDDVAHYVAGGVEAWAIDNIYHPLLKDIQRVERDLFDALDGVVAEAEGYAQDLVHSEALRRAAALAGVVAAVATVTTWVEECGAPMCEQMGPKTDFSKLVKALNVAGMLALLASFGTLTEEQLERLAATVVGIGAAPAETFVDLFVNEGDTLAHAIAATLPSIIP